jgi:peptidoglycan/LPS O-acetylase OafA/YrhL
MNPLLHLWSLGVEEQFYIFWPLILSVTLVKYSKKVAPIVISFTILSFLFNVIGVYRNPKFSFYFPISRFW